MKRIVILSTALWALGLTLGLPLAAEVREITTAQEATDALTQVNSMFHEAIVVGPDLDKLAQAAALGEAVAAYDPHHAIAVTVGKAFPTHYSVTVAMRLASIYYGLEENEKCLEWAMIAKPDYEAAIRASSPGLPPGPGPVWALMVSHCRQQLAAGGQSLGALAWVNGHSAWLPPGLALEDGLSFVRIRAFSEDLSAAVTWDEATQSAATTLGDKSITFTLGRIVASVQSPVVNPTTNNQELTTHEVALRIAPYLNNEGRMIVPLRPLVEALGGTVRWAPEAQIVYVTLPAPTGPATPVESGELGVQG